MQRRSNERPLSDRLEYAAKLDRKAVMEAEARRQTAKAHRDKLKAEQMRRRALKNLDGKLPPANPARSMFDLELAGNMEAAANAALMLPEGVLCGTGGEFAPPAAMDLQGIEDAVKGPDRVTLHASIERLELAEQAGVFDLAFDTAESVGATNSIEKMLAHQMAAAHKASLKSLAKADQQRDTVEQARLTNAAARLMQAFQQGALTLQRLRTGGNQTVTVQHVNVASGAQAIVGHVRTGVAGLGGDNAKNG